MHLHHLLDQHIAAAVEHDDVGAAVTLSGDDQHPTGLHRDIGDQRISHHDGADPVGQLDDLRLIENDVDGIGGSRALRRHQGGGEQHHRHRLPSVTPRHHATPDLRRRAAPIHRSSIAS